MAVTVGELNAKLGLNSSGFTSGLGRAQSRMSRFGSAVGAFVAKTALVVGTAMVGISGAATRAAISFDTGIREVFTLMPDLTDAARKQMEADVLAFSKAAGVVPGEVLPALYQAISAGVPPDNVFAFLETANKAAVAGVTTLETAVDGLSSVVNAYGSDVLTVEQASDAMFTAVRLGKTTFGELSESVFQVTPIAAAMGVSFNDVAAALSAITAGGTPTRVAATQVRQAIAELGKQGTIANKTFSELAGKTFQEFIAEGGSLQDALGLMAEAAEESDRSIVDMFGSIEAGQAALALTGSNAERAASHLNQMRGAAGATETAFGVMDEGTGRAMDRIKANLGALAVELGQKLLPAFDKAVQWVVDNFPAISAAVQAVFEAVGKAKDWLWDNVLQPLIDNVFKPVVEWVEDNWPAIKDAMKVTFDTVRTVVTELIDKALRPLWENVLKPLLAWVVDNWPSFMSTFQTVFDTVITVGQSLIDNVLMPLWDTVLKPLLAWVQENWPTFQAVFERVMGGIQVAVEMAGPIIRGIFETIGAAIQDVIAAVELLLGILPFGGVGNIIKGLDLPQPGGQPGPGNGRPITRAHTGLTIPGPVGQERLIMAQAGETITRAGAGGGELLPIDVRVTASGRVELDRREVGEMFMDGGVERIYVRTGRR